jgi:hypothetical protein
MDYAMDIRLTLEFESCSYISITRGKPSVLNKVFYEVQHFHLALSHRFAPYNPTDFLIIRLVLFPVQGFDQAEQSFSFRMGEALYKSHDLIHSLHLSSSKAFLTLAIALVISALS